MERRVRTAGAKGAAGGRSGAEIYTGKRGEWIWRGSEAEGETRESDKARESRPEQAKKREVQRGPGVVERQRRGGGWRGSERGREDGEKEGGGTAEGEKRLLEGAGMRRGVPAWQAVSSFYG